MSTPYRFSIYLILYQFSFRHFSLSGPQFRIVSVSHKLTPFSDVGTWSLLSYVKQSPSRLRHIVKNWNRLV